MSVRRIPMNYRNVTGFVANPLSDKPIGFESTLERDLVLLLTFCPTLTSCDSQPLHVFWNDEAGQVHRYTPDYLVHFSGDGQFLGRRTNRPWLIEVKYKVDLSHEIGTYRPIFQAAVQEAHRRGMYFRIFTEQEIRIPLLDNARFLLPFRRITPNPAVLEYVRSSISRLGSPTLREVLAACNGGHDRGMVIQGLWYLIATHQAHVDLDLSLQMRSRVSALGSMHA